MLANMLPLILRQSAQWHTNVSARPGEVVGKGICTAPQKQVAVADVAVDLGGCEYGVRDKEGKGRAGKGRGGGRRRRRD
jgi:hypothetical protein